MNQQQFGMYGIQPPAQMTPEQMAALQKQQQMFLKQQQQYMAQQQQLQKQLAREEQRNKLRNMNVKSMGTPTYNQSTPGPRVQSSGYHGYPQPGSFPQQQQQFVQQQFGQQPFQQQGFKSPNMGSQFTSSASFPQNNMKPISQPSQPSFSQPNNTPIFQPNQPPFSQPNQPSFSQPSQPPFS